MLGIEPNTNNIIFGNQNSLINCLQNRELWSNVPNEGEPKSYNTGGEGLRLGVFF